MDRVAECEAYAEDPDENDVTGYTELLSYHPSFFLLIITVLFGDDERKTNLFSKTGGEM